MTRRDLLRLSAGLGATVLLAACGGATAQAPVPSGAASAQGGAPKRGGTLRVALTNDPSLLDPHLSIGATAHHPLRLLFNTLVAVDKDGKAQPELAASWETPNDTTWRFRLRQGIKFHDGTDFNAAAVKWNYDRIMDPKTKSILAPNLQGLQEVAVIDDYTVEFRLAKAFGPLLVQLAGEPGMMVSPDAVQKAGADFALKPVGTGPFAFSEWIRDDHITLKRFDGYWEKDAAGAALPYLDQVIFRSVPDNTTRLTNLRTNNMDVMLSVPQNAYADVKADSSLRVFADEAIGFQHVWLNTVKPPFSNKALRQAFAASIDREAIVKSIYSGVSKAAAGPLTEANIAYDPSFKGWQRDLDTAKAKLAEGGQPNGFSFTLALGARELDPKVGEALQAQAAEAGITIKIEAKDFAIVSGDKNAGNFEAAMSTYSGTTADPDLMFEFFSSKSNKNYGKYNGGSDLDDLLLKGRSLSDPAQRKPIYQQAQKTVVEDAPVVFVSVPLLINATTAKVNGYQQQSDGAMRLKSVWLA